MFKYGLLDDNQNKLDYVLALTPQDFLERRLQTLVFKLGLAKSIHHARVLIRQRHIRYSPGVSAACVCALPEIEYSCNLTGCRADSQTVEGFCGDDCLLMQHVLELYSCPLGVLTTTAFHAMQDLPQACAQAACLLQGRQADCECAVLYCAGRQPEAH